MRVHGGIGIGVRREMGGGVKATFGQCPKGSSFFLGITSLSKAWTGAWQGLGRWSKVNLVNSSHFLFSHKINITFFLKENDNLNLILIAKQF